MPIIVKGESHTYIHEMDYGRRQRLHEILDTSDTWRELSQMLIPPYPREKIEKFSRAVFIPGGSPSDALLTDWGRGNAFMRFLSSSGTSAGSIYTGSGSGSLFLIPWRPRATMAATA